MKKILYICALTTTACLSLSTAYSSDYLSDYTPRTSRGGLLKTAIVGLGLISMPEPVNAAMRPTHLPPTLYRGGFTQRTAECPMGIYNNTYLKPLKIFYDYSSSDWPRVGDGSGGITDISICDVKMTVGQIHYMGISFDKHSCSDFVNGTFGVGQNFGNDPALLSHFKQVYRYDEIQAYKQSGICPTNRPTTSQPTYSPQAPRRFPTRPRLPTTIAPTRPTQAPSGPTPRPTRPTQKHSIGENAW